MATMLKESRSAVFPAADVEACIRDELADQALDQAILRPGRATTATPIAPRSWEPEIDSLVVVEVICAVEELLGIDNIADPENWDLKHYVETGIKAHSLYKALPNGAQKAIAAKGDWKTGRSWQTLATGAGLSEAYFRNI